MRKINTLEFVAANGVVQAGCEPPAEKRHDG